VKKPTPFGKYILLERINVGGMAEIFLARSRGVHGFKRILAIKKILPSMAEDKEFIAMFIDEARIAAELAHTGIIQIYELGRFEEDYYIAMEFVHGKDLRYIQDSMFRAKKPMPIPIAVFVAIKICEALDYAHTKKDPMGHPLGIIHRDVSPQNVIVSYEGEVKICDFGIAKAANRSQKTQAGILKGKFGYMSPEQVRGLPLDGRSDIFTVGTLLYEMLTLQRLFVGESDFSTLEKVRNAEVMPPSRINPDIPKELEDITLKVLSKDADDRYQTAGEFGETLQAFMLKNEVASSRKLAGFVKETFTSAMAAELKRLEEYQNLPESVLENTGLAEKLSARSKEGDGEEEVDLAGKTQIYASTTGDSGVDDYSLPPPIPLTKKKSGEVGKSSKLAEAQTVIFSEDQVGPIEALKPKKVEVLQKQKGRIVDDSMVGPGQSLRDRLFIPLLISTGLLLGLCLFLVFDKPPVPQVDVKPIFRLISWPATGVDVSIDGKQVALVTPYESRDIGVGSHRLKIKGKGYKDVERGFNIEKGTHFVLEIELQKEEVVEIEKREFEKKEISANLKVEKDSLPPKDETNKIKPAEKLKKEEVEAIQTVKKDVPKKIKKPKKSVSQVVKKKSPTKKTKFGYLVANTKPWSKVYIDGKYTGRETPIAHDKKLKLKAGKYKLSFETPDGKRHDFNIVIVHDKVEKIIKRLK
jgi:serine/threonine protein kinase